VCRWRACEDSGAFEDCGREDGRRVRLRELLGLRGLIGDNDDATNYSRNALLQSLAQSVSGFCAHKILSDSGLVRSALPR
jgi:hypothetical protein